MFVTIYLYKDFSNIYISRSRTSYFGDLHDPVLEIKIIGKKVLYTHPATRCPSDVVTTSLCTSQ